MKYFLSLFLILSALALSAQTQVVTITNPGAEPYRQPPSELDALEALAKRDEQLWESAMGRPLHPVSVDTVLAKFIVYADPEGLVRCAEDVWVVRVRNQWKNRVTPLDVACRRVLMAEYYAKTD